MLPGWAVRTARFIVYEFQRKEAVSWLVSRRDLHRLPRLCHRDVMAREHQSFAQFWPFYLREHSKPRTRLLHYAGTSLVVVVALFAVVTGRWWWLLAVPLA